MDKIKFMPFECKEVDIKQNPRISVGDKCYVDNYIIGPLLRLIGKKDDSRAIFNLSSPQEGSSHTKMEKQGF